MGANVLSLWRKPLTNGKMLVRVAGIRQELSHSSFYLTISFPFGLNQATCVYHSLGSRP